LKKGDTIELRIDSYAFEGKGVAKVNKSLIKPAVNLTESAKQKENYVVFVEGAYPGDEVIAQLRKIKSSFAEAKSIKVIKKSVFRTEPRCKHFGVCGGCKQQDLRYEKQLYFKQQQVKEVFKHIGNLTGYEFEEFIPSEQLYFYRNKMEFTFAEKRWLTPEEIGSDQVIDRSFALGFHIPRIYDKVLDIEECYLQSEITPQIVNFTRSFFKEKGTPIYSTGTHTGFLRHLVIRVSHHSNDLMVNLVTSKEDDELLTEYKDKLLEEIPGVTTLINNINQKKASIAVGDYEKVFYGNGYITDSIGKYTFRISANSFFQTNTLQAENLYSTALDFANLSGEEVVYDLYAGAGTISIFISGFAKQVYAFENVKAALEDAKQNAKINNVVNVEFINADLYKTILPVVEEKKIPKPDVVIIDPPRSGMHKNTVKDVLTLNPVRIVYVSCNPTTQARDVAMLVSKGYKLIKMRPVDMFPQTYHIENVALLENN